MALIGFGLKTIYSGNGNNADIFGNGAKYATFGLKVTRFLLKKVGIF